MIIFLLFACAAGTRIFTTATSIRLQLKADHFIKTLTPEQQKEIWDNQINSNEKSRILEENSGLDISSSQEDESYESSEKATRSKHGLTPIAPPDSKENSEQKNIGNEEMIFCKTFIISLQKICKSVLCQLESLSSTTNKTKGKSPEFDMNADNLLGSSMAPVTPKTTKITDKKEKSFVDALMDNTNRNMKNSFHEDFYKKYLPALDKQITDEIERASILPRSGKKRRMFSTSEYVYNNTEPERMGKMEEKRVQHYLPVSKANSRNYMATGSFVADETHRSTSNRPIPSVSLGGQKSSVYTIDVSVKPQNTTSKATEFDVIITTTLAPKKTSVKRTSTSFTTKSKPTFTTPKPSTTSYPSTTPPLLSSSTTYMKKQNPSNQENFQQRMPHRLLQQEYPSENPYSWFYTTMMQYYMMNMPRYM